MTYPLVRGLAAPERPERVAVTCLVLGFTEQVNGTEILTYRVLASRPGQASH